MRGATHETFPTISGPVPALRPLPGRRAGAHLPLGRTPHARHASPGRAGPCPRWARWLAGLAAVSAVAVGLWYAHAQGWLDPVYAWFHPPTREGAASGHGGMNMPGMDMGSMQPGAKKPSDVPGYAEVTLPGEV